MSSIESLECARANLGSLLTQLVLEPQIVEPIEHVVEFKIHGEMERDLMHVLSHHVGMLGHFKSTACGADRLVSVHLKSIDAFQAVKNILHGRSITFTESTCPVQEPEYEDRH